MQGKSVTLPLPWDTTYLKRWFTFVRALGQRYDANPAVVNVPATGPTSISEEMSLPNDSDLADLLPRSAHTGRCSRNGDAGRPCP